MPSFRAAAPPGLRATHALPLAGIVVLAVIFGTPGRDDSQVARAQSAAIPARAPAARSRIPAAAGAQAYPVPEELRGRDLSQQTTEAAGAKSAGCIACHK